jgi:tetratricopeptide (TPR) repeat protein
MIKRDEIERISAEKLLAPDMLAILEKEVLSLTDEDDRSDLCYSIATRLMTEGNLERAEFFTRLMETLPIERSWFFGDIAAKLSQCGKTEHALQLINEAILTARANGVEWQRAEALSKIATHLIELGQRAQALSLIQEAVLIAQLGEEQGDLQDSLDSAGVIQELAEKLALAGEYGEAQDVAYSIKHAIKRERTAQAVQTIIDNNLSAG